MRFTRRMSSVRGQRGQIIIFTLLSVVFLLVIGGGLASDVASMISLKGEIQSSLDAAALAGAGKLGFTTDTYPTARNFAVNYANINATRRGTVVLEPNPGNSPSTFDGQAAPYGDVLIGIWNPTKPDGIGAGKRFEPSLDPNFVNSVMCRYKRQVPASFTSLWGLFNFTVATSSVATANPPNEVPPDACLFPIGVGDCPFVGNSAIGCGATITFITSSGKDEGAGCLAPPCTNSAAWVGLDPAVPPNPSSLPGQINAAKGGGCAGSPLKTGDNIATNNGMAQPVMNAVESAFKEVYSSSGTQTVTDTAGNVKYSGKGWKVYIPVIHTDCPAGAISGSKQIVGWTTFVMTQVINKGDCAVANHSAENPWDAIGKAPNCLGTKTPKNSGALRAIFGYYSCEIIPANPNPLPGPIAALATKLRLVR